MPNNIEQISKNIIQKINALELLSTRLSIKKFRSKDINHNIDHEMDAGIMRFIRDPIAVEEIREKTIKSADDWSGKESDWVLLSLRLRSNNHYIGLVCFRFESIENNTVEMGWRLGHDAMGKGYATEAAQCLLDFIKIEIKPHKVVAYCVAKNAASANIMTKLGMKKEGHLREYSKLGGKWHDEVIFGLIL
ncbi:MAG: GNAT family N-acetyltransferase [Marinicellaceae bacterium]